MYEIFGLFLTLMAVFESRENSLLTCIHKINPNGTKFCTQKSLNAFLGIDNSSALHLWNSYITETLETERPQSLHMAYRKTIAQWNSSVYKTIQDLNYVPLADISCENSNSIFVQNTMDRSILKEKDLLKLLFHYARGRTNAPLTGRLYNIAKIPDIFWIAVYAQKKIELCGEFLGTTEVRYIKRFLKIVAMMHAKTHWNLEDIVRRQHEVIENPESEWDNQIDREIPLARTRDDKDNACPIVDNYQCNAVLKSSKTISSPCYCALPEFEMVILTDALKKYNNCISEHSIDIDQMISVTFNSTFSKHYFSERLQMLEYVVVAMVKSTKLPGIFERSQLSVDPVVIYRIHCSDTFDSITVQFNVYAKMLASENGTFNSADYIYYYLTPARFLEEAERQNVFSMVKEMGMSVLHYGIVDKLLPLFPPESDVSPSYVDRQTTGKNCRLPESKYFWNVFQWVVFSNSCSHFAGIFWKKVAKTAVITWIFCMLVVLLVCLRWTGYQWMMTFGLIQTVQNFIQSRRRKSKHCKSSQQNNNKEQ